jgi:hypothetical protein
MFKIITTSILLAFFCQTGQSQVKLTKCIYSVDKQISIQLKKYELVDSGQLKNSMTIKVPWDDHTMFDQTLDCYTKSYLSNDTVFITGHMIGELGYGFMLTLFRDSCVVFPFAFSDGKIYKYELSDPSYIDFIPLVTKTQKVVLSKKPTYTQYDSIEGFVELGSQPFYYKDLKGIFKIQIKAYFKTASINRRE